MSLWLATLASQADESLEEGGHIVEPSECGKHLVAGVEYGRMPTDVQPELSRGHRDQRFPASYVDMAFLTFRVIRHHIGHVDRSIDGRPMTCSRLGSRCVVNGVTRIQQARLCRSISSRGVQLSLSSLSLQELARSNSTGGVVCPFCAFEPCGIPPPNYIVNKVSRIDPLDRGFVTGNNTMKLTALTHSRLPQLAHTAFAMLTRNCNVDVNVDEQ